MTTQLLWFILLIGGSYSWLRTRRRTALILVLSTLPAIVGPYLIPLLPGTNIIEVSPGVYESNQVHLMAQRTLRYASIVGAVLAGVTTLALVWAYLTQLRRDRSDEPSELP